MTRNVTRMTTHAVSFRSHFVSDFFLGIPKKMGIFWVVLTFDTKLMFEIIDTLGKIIFKTTCYNYFVE